MVGIVTKRLPAGPGAIWTCIPSSRAEPRIGNVATAGRRCDGCGAAAVDEPGDAAGAEAAGANDGADPDDGAADPDEDDGDVAGVGEQPMTSRTTRLVVASRASVVRIPSPPNGMKGGRPAAWFVTARNVGLVTR
jgi:hypothetical protein